MGMVIGIQGVTMAMSEHDEAVVGIYRAWLGDTVCGVCPTCAGPVDPTGGSAAFAAAVRHATWPSVVTFEAPSIEGPKSHPIDRKSMEEFIADALQHFAAPERSAVFEAAVGQYVVAPEHLAGARVESVSPGPDPTYLVLDRKHPTLPGQIAVGLDYVRLRDDSPEPRVEALAMQPTVDRVLLRPQHGQSGIVVAIGPGVYDLSVGDRVHVGRYSGDEVSIAGVPHLLLREGDVLLVGDGVSMIDAPEPLDGSGGVMIQGQA